MVNSVRALYTYSDRIEILCPHTIVKKSYFKVDFETAKRKVLVSEMSDILGSQGAIETQKTCEFCRIVKKGNDASIVFKDDKVMAFLWTKAIAEGHTFVIPKVHYENIYSVPDDEIAHLFKVVKRVPVAVKRGLNSDGINIGQNNGRAADQTVFHLHVHVLPRFAGQKLPDGILEVRREKREETADKIRAGFKSKLTS